MSHQGQPAIQVNPTNPVELSQTPTTCAGKELEKKVELSINELIHERDTLKAEMEKLKTERDDYLGYLYALTHKEFDFDKEELLANVGTRKPLRDFIAELEQKHGG
jgi:hypothetical protein